MFILCVVDMLPWNGLRGGGGEISVLISEANILPHMIMLNFLLIRVK